MPPIRCYSAGRKLEQALEAARRYNERGLKTSLSHLPVKTRNAQAVRREAERYVCMLRAIDELGVESDVTVKPHQFGIYAGYEMARDGVAPIVEEAERLGNFVWIDMELKPTVDDTIRLYRELHARRPCVGICLQAYLRRTESDLDRLLAEGATVRLVKGFYKTSDFAKWSDVTANYERLMMRMFDRGVRPVVATNDLALVDKALGTVRERKMTNVEFQFAKGVRDELAEELAAQGFNVRLYLPFGDALLFLLRGLPSFDKWRNLQRIAARPTIR